MYYPSVCTNATPQHTITKRYWIPCTFETRGTCTPSLSMSIYTLYCSWLQLTRVRFQSQFLSRTSLSWMLVFEQCTEKTNGSLSFLDGPLLCSWFRKTFRFWLMRPPDSFELCLRPFKMIFDPYVVVAFLDLLYVASSFFSICMVAWVLICGDK